MKGENTGFQSSVEGGTKAQTEESEMVQKNREKHMARQRIGVGGSGRQRKGYVKKTRGSQVQNAGNKSEFLHILL